MKNHLASVNPTWLRLMAISIVVGVLGRSLDVFLGFLLGVEKYWAATLVFSLAATMGIIGEFVWWQVMSSLKEKSNGFC